MAGRDGEEGNHPAEVPWLGLGSVAFTGKTGHAWRMWFAKKEKNFHVGS